MSSEQESSRLFQDISLLVGSALPIAQLFFGKLPESVTSIFLAPEYFTGISIVTLFVTYVLVVAYQAKPYFSVVLFYHTERKRKLDEYYSKVNAASDLRNFTGQKQSKKIDDFLSKLRKNNLKQPHTISSDNVVLICVLGVIASSLTFILLGQVHNASSWHSILQSVSYVFLVCLTVLALTVYRKNDANSKRYESNQVNRTSRAIDLAVHSNCFGNLPQVKLLGTFETSGFPSFYHIDVEFNGEQYKIVTDQAGSRLIAFTKI